MVKITHQQISEALEDKTSFLEEKFKVKKLGVFGSTARGDQKESSDIDMLVDFYEPISLFKFVELEEHLGNILKKKVDLVTKNALKPAIKEDVLRQTIYV